MFQKNINYALFYRCFFNLKFVFGFANIKLKYADRICGNSNNC